MSTSTPSRPTALTPDIGELLERLAGGVATGVRAVAFWTAALLPFALVGALAAGLGSSHPTAVVAGLAVTAVCAVLGHDYNR